MADPPVTVQPPLRESVRTRLGRAGHRLRNLALDWGLRSGHRDYARFIILGEGRSGSNFLRGLLNSHPRILAFGELFRFADAIGWEFPDHDRYLSTARLIALSRDDPGAFLEREVFRRHPGAIRAVGFKIFYYHADRSSRSAVWSYLESHREIKVIHIKRRNTLRALLSLKKAFATNRWTETGPPAPDTLSVLLDPDECWRRFALAEGTKARFDAVFGQHARLDVVYEELERDHEGQMSRVQDFLGVDRHAVKPLTYKQASMPLARAIVNYGDLKAMFADTRWKEFFDE
jgi:LPS sulfotransferase NodH